MSRNNVLDSGATTPDDAPINNDYQNAVAEMNALSTRIEAAKVQHSRWKSKNVAERKRLMDSLHLLMQNYDKHHKGQKPTPPKIPETVLHPVPPKLPIIIVEPSSAEPPPEQKVQEQKEPERNPLPERDPSPAFTDHSTSRSHAKLFKSKSVASLKSPWLANTPEHSMELDPMSGDNSLRSSARIEEEPELMSDGASTSRRTPALSRAKSVTLILPNHPSGGGEATPEASPNNNVTIAPTEPIHEEPEETTPTPPPGSVPLREIADTPVSVSYRSTPGQLKSTTPHLMVTDASKPRSEAFGRRPPPRLVHRATALDLDEVRKMAQRTFQRQINEQFYIKH